MTTDDESKELLRAIYETVINFYRSRGYIDANGDLDVTSRQVLPVLSNLSGVCLAAAPADIREEAVERYLRDIAREAGYHLGAVTLNVAH